MLRRNMDTKTGLVNGAIGTVLSIATTHVTVQFDHITEPYKVKMAYVTIHKCQDLSLDGATVDLSDLVLSAGMAYIALSRVRSLSGLYLSAFDPKSIMVSLRCLKEVNRLR